MPTPFGNSSTADLYFGDVKRSKAYWGDTLVYEAMTAPSNALRSFTLVAVGTGGQLAYTYRNDDGTLTPADPNVYWIRYYPNTFVAAILRLDLEVAYLPSVYSGKTPNALIVDGVSHAASVISQIAGHDRIVTTNQFTLSDFSTPKTINIGFTDGTTLYQPPTQNFLVDGGVRNIQLQSVNSGSNRNYIHATFGAGFGSLSPADSNFILGAYYPNTYLPSYLRNTYRIQYTRSALNGKIPSHLIIKGIEFSVTNESLFIQTPSVNLVNPTQQHTLNIKYTDNTYEFSSTQNVTLLQVNTGANIFYVYSFENNLGNTQGSVNPTNNNLLSVSWFPNTYVSPNIRQEYRLGYSRPVDGKVISHLVINGTEYAVGTLTYYTQHRPYTLNPPTGTHTINIKFTDGTYLYEPPA